MVRILAVSLKHVSVAHTLKQKPQKFIHAKSGIYSIPTCTMYIVARG